MLVLTFIFANRKARSDLFILVSIYVIISKFGIFHVSGPLLLSCIVRVLHQIPVLGEGEQGSFSYTTK